MTNPNEVTEFDDLLLRHGTTGVKQVWFTRKEVLAIAGEAAQSGSATSDAARLDWLQKRGATVSMVPGKGSDWQFQIGGLYGATDTNIRTAIDAAIAAGGDQ